MREQLKVRAMEYLMAADVENLTVLGCSAGPH